MSKKGMELQINFVVTLIIILAIFGGSIVMITKFFNTADKLDEQLKEEMIGKIDNLLMNDKVAIPKATREVRVGKNALFGIGVLNLEGATPSTFYYNLDVSAGFDEDDRAFGSGAPAADFPDCYKSPSGSGGTPNDYVDCFRILANPTMDIKNYEKDINWVKIWPEKTIDSGTYVIDVYICRDDATGVSSVTDCDGMSGGNPDKSELYDGTIHKIRITIP